MNECINEWMEGGREGRMDGWINKWINTQINGEWVNEREWVNLWQNEWIWILDFAWRNSHFEALLFVVETWDRHFWNQQKILRTEMALSGHSECAIFFMNGTGCSPLHTTVKWNLGLIQKFLGYIHEVRELIPDVTLHKWCGICD